MEGGEAERQAILAWRKGVLLTRQKEYKRAVVVLEQAEAGLPAGGSKLAELLGEAMDEVAGELMWPEGQRFASYSAEAERLLLKVVRWLPEKQGAWYRLGAVLDDAKRHEEAISAYQQSIALDPKWAYPIALAPNYAYPHSNLGNVYGALGRHEEAISAYQQAIALDSHYAVPHHNLGIVYRDLGRHEEAIAAFQQAITLDSQIGGTYATLAGLYRQLGQEVEYQKHIEIARGLIAKENEYNRACFEAIAGNHEEALTLLARAIAKAPGNRLWAQQDPDFASLRQDPRFQALVHGSS
ncbi:MAG: tetratricopeptide repeat protein [Chloroflexi bacterium]|nr:tetratricopeptide repeat protein [Chloroflexota bacterium]